jgi:hypothetical protein
MTKKFLRGPIVRTYRLQINLDQWNTIWKSYTKHTPTDRHFIDKFKSEHYIIDVFNIDAYNYMFYFSEQDTLMEFKLKYL